MAEWIEPVPGTLWRQTLDGVLVLAPDRDEPLHITSPGDAMWLLLGSQPCIDELVTELTELFDADEATVRADVQQVLAALRRVGAVQACRQREH